MRRLYKIFIANIIVLVMLAGFQLPVFAASFSVGRSTSSVAPGGKFTVTVSCPSGAGRFSVSASNGRVSSGSLWVDNGSSSVTVTAGSSGTVTVTVSASDVTANDETVISGSRSVSVSIASSNSNSNSNHNQNNNTNNNQNSNNANNTQKPVEDTRSKVNTLSSLTVSSGSLNPQFNANTTSYEVNVAGDVSSITINAKAQDAKATVSGTGQKNLEVGSNTFQIVCRAEDGGTKTYTVNVNVDEEPLVYTKYDDKKIGVVRNLKDLAVPNSFEQTTVKIDGQEVTAYHSNNMNKTIIYMVDEKGEKNFYLYDEKEGITSVFIPTTILGRNVYIIDVKKDDLDLEDMKFKDITIDNNTLKGWVFEDKDYAHYSLIMVMNEKGEKVIYQYEDTENTLQLYRQVKVKEKDVDQTMTYVLATTTVLFALSTIGVLVYLQIFKKKSISAIKAYYERRNKRL